MKENIVSQKEIENLTLINSNFASSNRQLVKQFKEINKKLFLYENQIKLIKKDIDDIKKENQIKLNIATIQRKDPIEIEKTKSKIEIIDKINNIIKERLNFI
jgi:hypothetical protein